MANPFDGIISTDLKTLWKNAILALIASTACTVPCRLYFGTTKFTPCSNCIRDNATGKSANVYNGTGPYPFPEGFLCPYCKGESFVAEDATEDISLCVIRDYKKWRHIVQNVTDEKVGTAMTLSAIETIGKLMEAKEIVFNTNLSGYIAEKFQRDGAPEPIGFGQECFVITRWKLV